MEIALDRLLAAWRARRSPVLAELIDGVTERMGVPPIEAAANEWHPVWLARESARRPAEVGALVRALPGPPDGSGKWIEAFQRLERVESWPADPRVSAGLVEIFEARPLTSARTAPFYQVAARLVVAIGDVRALEALRIVLDRRGARGTVAETPIVEAIAGLERALAGGVPAPSPEEQALACAVREASRGPGPGIEDLLARVHANPDDDAARAEYAKFLVQRGDVRGEYILISLRRHAGEALSPEEREREGKLLEANRGKWLGELEPAVASFGVRFERGFPVAASVLGKPELVAGLRGHPAWSTLREINLEYAPPGLVHPVFRHLRVVKGASDSDLTVFCTTEAGASVEEIVWRGPAIDERGGLDEAVLRALAEPGALPRLRRLRFHPCGHAHRLRAGGLSALLDTAAVRRVESLGGATGASSLARWIEALAGREQALSAVEIEITPETDYVGNVVLRVSRGEDGRFSALRAVIGAPRRDTHPIVARRQALSDLCRALQSLPEGAPTSLRIEGDREAEPEPEQLLELERAIERFPRLDAASRSESAERRRAASPEEGAGEGAARGGTGPVEATTEDWERLARQHLSRLGAPSIPVRVDPHEITIDALRWYPWPGRSIDVVDRVVEALCRAALSLQQAPERGVDVSWVEHRIGVRGAPTLLEVVSSPTLAVHGDRLVVQIREDGWTGPHDRGLVTNECGGVPLDRLPLDEGLFDEVAGHLAAAASWMRSTVIRTCRFCLGSFSPVDMHDRTACHGCAERWLGVMH